MSCLHSCLSWVCRYTHLMLKSAASCWFMAEEVSISLKGWRELCLHNFLQMSEDPCYLQEMVLRKYLKSGGCVLLFAACLFRAVSRNMCEVWATAQAASLPSSWGCHIRNNDESSCKSVGQGHLEGFSASTMSVTPVVEACSWILYAITDMWIFLENWFRVCAACYCVCDTWQMKQKWSKESALHGFCSMQSKHASKETQIRCWSENNVWENIQLFSKCIWVHLQAPYGDFASTFC